MFQLISQLCRIVFLTEAFSVSILLGESVAFSPVRRVNVGASAVAPEEL